MGDQLCKIDSKSNWADSLAKKWKRSKKHTLDEAIRLLAQHAPSQPHPLTVPGQPFDSHLLALSPLYRKSRALLIQNKGAYHPSLNTSPRTLSSLALLEPVIEYSPVAHEYIWAATDPIQRKKLDHVFQIRGMISNLFHEQNHRILWKLLPNAPTERKRVRRYLNFAESLVVTLDMALSNQLNPPLRSLFHLCGITYDRGLDDHSKSWLPTKKNSKRLYRNYLQACAYATYLHLELYSAHEVLRATQARFNGELPIGTWAAERSLLLDAEFVKKTNPFWQFKNWKEASARLQGKPGDSLELSDDPMNPLLNYLWAEKWFEQMGL
jgi:hypothetical protein